MTNLQRALFLQIFQAAMMTLLLSGCGNSGQMKSASISSEDPILATGIAPSLEITESDRVRAYRRASLIFLNQVPTAEKIQSVRTEEGYQKAIEEMIESDAFVQKMQSYHQEFFKLQGREGEVNLNEPANLAAYLFKTNQDFREILRAEYCVDDELNQIECSSFAGSEGMVASQAAGAVTTQAFLSKWNGPFAFLRASETLKAFACHDYPDEDDVGMTPDEISESVHTFACTNCNPQCYSCHNTMNARASLFYTFDTTGVFNPNPNQLVAIKRDTGDVSEREDLLKPGVVARYRQRQVRTVKEYANELSRSPKFRQCLSKRLTAVATGSPNEQTIPKSLNQKIDALMLKNEFRLKDFYRDLLGSPEYVAN